MKTPIFTIMILSSLLLVNVPAVNSQTQNLEGYTIFSGALGPQVCVGKWIPSKDPVTPGVCEGQVVGISQLAAVSARQSVDRLDNILGVLNSIDQKMAVNNDQILMLIKAASNPAVTLEQKRQAGELLSEAISQRFGELPEALLANDAFAREMENLEADILGEIERHYSK